MWVGVGGTWTPVVKQWAGSGGVWRAGFDTAPGPLASIVVTPSAAPVSMGGTQTFAASGFDADGIAVDLTSTPPTWTITTSTDSVSPTTAVSTTFTAGTTADIGTITATVGSVSGSASYSVS